MQVSLQYAAEHFTDLFLVARNGEEVEIVAPDKITFKLVVTNRILEDKTEQAAAEPTGRRRFFGAGKGLVTPPTDEQWAQMKKELEADMLDGPFFPLDCV